MQKEPGYEAMCVYVLTLLAVTGCSKSLEPVY